MATLLSPSGAVLANGLANAASRSATTTAPDREAQPFRYDASSSSSSLLREVVTSPARISSSGSRSDAPYTTSGRTASTTATVAAVMMPSPMPISRCTPTIAPNTVDRDAPPAPPTAYSSVNASDAITTDRNPAIPDATTTLPLVRGSSQRSAAEDDDIPRAR